MASEIILTVSERRNRQKLTLSSTAAPFVFGRGRDCSFVLRRNNVGEHQFTIEYKNNAWLMQDAGSTTCGTWYNNRYIHSGEEVTCSRELKSLAQRAPNSRAAAPPSL